MQEKNKSKNVIVNLYYKRIKQRNQKDEEDKKDIVGRKRRKEEQVANLLRGRIDIRSNYQG